MQLPQFGRKSLLAAFAATLSSPAYAQPIPIALVAAGIGLFFLPAVLVRSQMKSAALWAVIAISIVPFQAEALERPLARVEAPGHDPLYVDTSSIRRSGTKVSFSYVLDVSAAAEGRTAQGGWKSNELEATIDCAQRSFTSGRLTAYAGPKASGAVTGGYMPTAAERITEKIVPKSTFAYLSEFVCAKK